MGQPPTKLPEFNETMAELKDNGLDDLEAKKAELQRQITVARSIAAADNSTFGSKVSALVAGEKKKKTGKPKKSAPRVNEWGKLLDDLRSESPSADIQDILLLLSDYFTEMEELNQRYATIAQAAYDDVSVL